MACIGVSLGQVRTHLLHILVDVTEVVLQRCNQRLCGRTCAKVRVLILNTAMQGTVTRQVVLHSKSACDACAVARSP